MLFLYTASVHYTWHDSHSQAAYAHHTVTELVPVAVTLDKIFKIPGAACCCKKQDPQNDMELGKALCLNRAYTVINQNTHKENRAKNLHQAYKAVGAQEA